MPIIQRNAMRVALAVEWSIEEDRQAAKAVAKTKWLGVFRNVDEGVLVGLAEQAPGRGDVYAGALLIAAVFPDAVLIEDIGDEQVWVCACRDGIPLPGSDRVCDAVEARSIITEIISYHPNTVLLGTLSEAQATLDDVLARVSKDAIKAARMRPVGPQWVKLGLLATVFIGLAGAAMMVMNAAHRVEAPSGNIQDVLDAINKAKYEAEQKRLLAMYREDVAKKRAELEQRRPLDEQVEAWMSALRRIPLSFEGWTPREVECTTSECIVSWQPGQGAIASTASRMLDVVSINSSEIKARLLVSPVASHPWVFEKANVQAMIWTVLSHGQRYRSPVTIDESPTAVQVALPQGLKAVPVDIVGYRGRWSLSIGQEAFVRLPAMAHHLARFPLSADRMVVHNVMEAPMIQVEGDYVVF